MALAIMESHITILSFSATSLASLVLTEYLCPIPTPSFPCAFGVSRDFIDQEHEAAPNPGNSLQQPSQRWSLNQHPLPSVLHYPGCPISIGNTKYESQFEILCDIGRRCKKTCWKEQRTEFCPAGTECFNIRGATKGTEYSLHPASHEHIDWRSNQCWDCAPRKSPDWLPWLCREWEDFWGKLFNKSLIIYSRALREMAVEVVDARESFSKFPSDLEWFAQNRR